MNNKCYRCSRIGALICTCENADVTIREINLSQPPPAQYLNLPQQTHQTLSTRIETLLLYTKSILHLTSSYIKAVNKSTQSTISKINQEIKTCSNLLLKSNFSEIDQKRLEFYKSNPLPAKNPEPISLDKGFTDLLNSFNFPQPDLESIDQAYYQKLLNDSGLNIMGHTGGINSIFLSNDSKFIATAGNDKSVKIWDAESLKLIQVIKDCGSIINTVIMMNDNNHVITCSVDAKICIWNWVYGNKVMELKGQEDLITSMALSYDGLTLIAGSKDKTIAVHNLNYPNNPKYLIGNEQTVMSVNFAQKYTKIISGSADATVRVFNLMNFTLEFTFKGHTGKVNCVIEIPGGYNIASASQDCSIRIWSLFSQDCVKVIQGNSKEIISIAYNYYSGILAASTAQYTIKLIRISNYEEIGVLKGHTRHINSLVFIHQDQLISGSSDRTTRIWNISYLNEIAKLPGHTDKMKLCIFDQSNTFSLTYGDDNTIRYWNVPLKQQIKCIDYSGPTIKEMLLSPDNLFLFLKLSEFPMKKSVISLESFSKLHDIESASQFDDWSSKYPSLSSFMHS